MATARPTPILPPNFAPEGLAALLKPTLVFETEASSPFADGYSVRLEEAALAEYIAAGASPDDPMFDRYAELEERRDRLQQMQRERDDHRGADVIATRAEAQGIDAIGGLVDGGLDQMMIHTIEAYRIFLGRSRDTANHINPIIGGKRVASCLRNLWMLTANDNPYAEWALLRHEHGVNDVHKHLQDEIAKAEGMLDQQRKRGLVLAVLASSSPMTVNLGFRSPYGYAISMLVVDYDHYVRLQKTLQRKNLLTDEEVRASLRKAQRAILNVFYGTARFDRWLSRPEIRALNRGDWISSDEDAAKRVQFAVSVFGPVPAAIYKAAVSPSHSRRHYSLTDAEQAVLKQVGDQLEAAEQAEVEAGSTPVPAEDAAVVS
ncbi:TIGR03761 family integrating conjugative element protein [Acidovorax sp. SUPP950]|uniref:PFL_4669 family integrating conjugative element protein n=1 Tax=Acidovorax sp. SUPP950 TaxID=511901 RepID=UPI0023C2B195|nr:TIGR03761 family integrating conjugative element protein [Acidovorax sp. SUPP950]GKS73332.1 TIGR03761 family integrating conjugative element protein [Acidovorax sp. SUPP950]